MSKKRFRAANIFEQLQIFEKEILRLESKVSLLESKLERMIQIERNHLLRVKNREELSDYFLWSGPDYQDLSPEKAHKLYHNKDFDFILLDVSAADYQRPIHLPEAICIPWCELSTRFHEIKSQTIPILIISEDGVSSILASHFLATQGYFNCNNVSGGYQSWVKKGLNLIQDQAA